MENWTPIKPRGKGLTHMTSLTDAGRTQCGKNASGWMVSMGHVTCLKCKKVGHER